MVTGGDPRCDSIIDRVDDIKLLSCKIPPSSICDNAVFRKLSRFGRFEDGFVVESVVEDVGVEDDTGVIVNTESDVLHVGLDDGDVVDTESDGDVEDGAGVVVGAESALALL